MNLCCCFILSQAPLTPGARRFSEDSTVSAKEDEGGSSDGSDEPSHQDASQRGKPGDGKENTKVEDLFFSISPPSSLFQTVDQSPGAPHTHLMPGWQLSQLVRETSPLALTIPLALQSSGFGWFSWFRSKPANSESPSGDEDSSDSSDSEVTSTDGLAAPPRGPQRKAKHITALASHSTLG